MSTYYKSIKNSAGDNFGVGRVHTIKEWREIMRKWLLDDGFVLTKEEETTEHGVIEGLLQSFGIKVIKLREGYKHQYTIMRVINFDDYVDDGSGAWSQICKRCIDKYGIVDGCNGIAQDAICGVYGCNNIADYYIDFDDAATMPTVEIL